MLDRTFIRENIDSVEDRLAKKNFSFDRNKFIELDRQERSTRMEWEKLRAQRNRTSDQIADLKKHGEEASEKITQMKQVSFDIKKLDERVKSSEEEIGKFLALIPNLPHSSVPVGTDESDNTVERELGQLPKFNFEAKDHIDVGLDLGILDTERAGKVTGSRFANYFGAGARLERGLINFMLDIHTREHGYVEILPPFMANRRSFFGTGNLPKFEEDLFAVKDTEYFLIPTAEVPVTNVFAGEVLAEEILPISFVACTPCFRSEAGSYGKDTRGLIRQHQFNKVELVKICPPQDSYEELEKLTGHAEEILKRLEIPYRVVTLSTGDMSFSSAKTYDLEAWIPSQNTYREISSCSNFEDFQARRAHIRFKPIGSKQTKFVHTLNGSGIAVGRTWVAIVENFQQEDGSVVIPDVLRPYMDGDECLTKESFVLP